MELTILSRPELGALVADLVRAGTRVIAPVPVDEDATRTEYRPIASLDDAALGGALQRRSLKELFLPPSEVLLRYRERKDGVDIEEVPVAFERQVVLGARPCDAAGVETLDAVMAWGRRDELWFGRREATTIVSLACPAVDSSCFCTAVGLGPESTRGSDALLVPIGGAVASLRSGPPTRPDGGVDAYLHDTEPFGGAADLEDSPASGSIPPASGPRAYLAQALTPRGEALLAGRGHPAGPADLEDAERFGAAARGRVDATVGALRLSPGVDRLQGWLAAHFDHPLWQSLALRCHGCGACAAVCPTCHCFDIVDEHDGCGRGARRRNWDSCQLPKFTAHASGHNPRPTQTERFRQRVMHKFSIYPSRFDSVLCTGCGRCARACAAGMNLPEILGRLVELAGAEKEGGAR